MNMTTTIIIWAIVLVPALLMLSPALYGAFEEARAVRRLFARLVTRSRR